MQAISPRSLEEAVRQLAARPELRPVAGCTDLMVAEAENLESLPGVMDLLAVPELQGIRWRDGSLEIGATTTFSAIGRSPEVREVFPSLAEAASMIGGWQIQNRATIGGNMANASPAGDSLPVLLALDAAVQDEHRVIFILDAHFRKSLEPPAEQAVVGAVEDRGRHLQTPVRLNAVEVLLVTTSAAQQLLAEPVA